MEVMSSQPIHGGLNAVLQKPPHRGARLRVFHEFHKTGVGHMNMKSTI
jgi:hypothetical protein